MKTISSEILSINFKKYQITSLPIRDYSNMQTMLDRDHGKPMVTEVPKWKKPAYTMRSADIAGKKRVQRKLLVIPNMLYKK